VKKLIVLGIASAVSLFGAACSNQGPAPKEAPAPPAESAAAPAAEPATMEGHPPIEKSAADATAPAAGSIEKAESGTVADIFANKDKLAGKEVTVRGKVMKFSPMIMGRNWVHIQDGTGDAASGTNDLTVTTSDSVKVGDTVLVKGKLAANKDFGAGYSYDVIIEEAKVTVE